MKKTFSAIVCLFMLLMFPGVSLSAAPGPYISGQLGMAYLTDSQFSDASAGEGTVKFDLGFAVGVAGGYNFGWFREEGEIGYQINYIDSFNACSGGTCVSGVSSSGERTALSFMANSYVDFYNDSKFSFYITAGVGVANVVFDHYADSGLKIGNSDSTDFAYQAGIGIGYAINKNITIDLKYRYFATLDSDFEGTEVEFKSHNVYLGLRYNF